MSEQVDVAYGYEDDEVGGSGMQFGLNHAACRLVKFEFNPTGGKDGKEQEALEIVFNINGKDKSYRKFPVTQAYAKGSSEPISDRNSAEFKQALKDWGAIVTHILHCFITKENLKRLLAVPITNFKTYCDTLSKALPANFKDVPLDIFLGYQWDIPEGKDRKYLEIPKKMSYGAWLAPSVTTDVWTEHRVENPEDTVTKALFYTNQDGKTHPFIRSGWYMTHKFAFQEKEGGAQTDTSAADAAIAGQTTEQQTTPTSSASTPEASAW